MKIYDPIFVGGKKYITIQKEEIPDNIDDDCEVVAMSCCSILFLNHGVNGTLYRTGEHLLASDITNGSQHQLPQISFLYVPGMVFAIHNYVKGKLFSTSSAIHTHSSNAIVIPTSNLIVTPTVNIIRKVMLYPEL